MKRYLRTACFLLCVCLLLSSVLGLSACSEEPVTENAVTSVEIKDEEIRVKAVFTKGFLDDYKEKKVYLFELPSVFSTDVDLTELDPVAEAKPRSSLTFELSVKDGMRSRLHSSFLVASYETAGKRYTPLTPPMSLSNPEAVADYTSPAESAENSIKGLVSGYPSDAIRLGVTHTVVDVAMDELILSSWREGAVSYIYNGVTRYLDAEALKALDETVGVYTAAGVEVYLRFVLGSPNGKGVPAGLYMSAAPDAEDYAVNMTTPFSSVIMEGFFDFMSARYAAPADGSLPVSAFILGYRVNNAVTHNAGAGVDLASYVTNYEKLVRVAHVALRSHNAAGRVYISLDNRRTVTDGKGWDVAAFLSAFADESEMRGDYAWHVACELYADTPAVWEENAVADASYYTARNLGVLTDLLDSPVYLIDPSGESRRLLISGYAIPAVTRGGKASADFEAQQASSYAYAYLTCVQNGRVEALIYSEYADTAATADEVALCGLWKVKHDTTLTDSGLDLSLLPSAPRPIYDVFSVIDTTEAATLSSALTSVMGASYAKLESALTGKASPVTLLKGSASLKGYEPTHKRATPLFTFTDGHLCGFESAGNLTFAELTEAETLGTVALHARFDRTALCDPMGLTVTLPATDLIGAKELIFDLYAGQTGAASAALPTVTLRLTRSAKGAVADGDGEILYIASVEGVNAVSWQSATFSVSSFTEKLDASDEVTLTLLMDYPADSAPTGKTTHDLGLAGIYTVGNTAASGTSSGVVIAVVVLLVALVAGVFVFLFLRNKRRA